MKHLLSTITLCALAAAVLPSCSDSESPDDSPVETPTRVTVEFTPLLRATSKATDSAFEDGDRIALARDNMRSENAYSLVYNASASRFDYVDESRKITKDLNESLRYIAFYPDESNGVCDVQAIDEHTMDFNAGHTDLCMAVEQTASSRVTLKFSHMLSKVNVEVKNAPADITGVYLLNLKPKYRVDIEGDNTLEGSPVSSSAMKYNPADGCYYYYAAPLNNLSKSESIGRITLANGQTFNFAAPVDGTFESGKAYTWTVDLADGQPSFTGSISDWD